MAFNKKHEAVVERLDVGMNDYLKDGYMVLLDSRMDPVLNVGKCRVLESRRFGECCTWLVDLGKEEKAIIALEVERAQRQLKEAKDAKSDQRREKDLAEVLKYI